MKGAASIRKVKRWQKGTRPDAGSENLYDLGAGGGSTVPGAKENPKGILTPERAASGMLPVKRTKRGQLDSDAKIDKKERW